MAGHSQFKNIMHRKGRQDAARAKMFSKLAREITVAAKAGSPDEALVHVSVAQVHDRHGHRHGLDARPLGETFLCPTQ